MILGIDEVGRGPWAGPLVVGAVVLPEPCTIEELNDSKKLSDKKRRELDVRIREQALGWGLGWVFSDELDEVGLAEALRRATIRAVEAVNAPYHEIIIDGTINFLKETNKGRYVTTLPKADALIPAVSAASIIAKVARDTYMTKQDAQYPAYGFSRHVGYGTAQHREALAAHGVTPLHRRSFAPIAKLISESKSPVDTAAVMSNAATTVTSAVRPKSGAALSGARAEAQAARWLEQQGYEIIDRNWKTKWCEIDIVAQKQGVMYFVEVKYRSTQQYGGGVAAITPKKRQQMRFAAEFYLASHDLQDHTAALYALALDARGKGEFLEVE